MTSAARACYPSCVDVAPAPPSWHLTGTTPPAEVDLESQDMRTSRAIATDNDVANELLSAVAEQSFLWELGDPACEYFGPDGAVWVLMVGQRRRAQVLLGWLQSGVLDLVAYADWAADAPWAGRATRCGDYLVLASDDAAALLSECTRWDRSHPDSTVMLCRSDATDEVWDKDVHPFSASRALLGLPPHPPKTSSVGNDLPA